MALKRKIEAFFQSIISYVIPRPLQIWPYSQVDLSKWVINPFLNSYIMGQVIILVSYIQ